MVVRTSPFRVPFPRRVIIRIHQDLFTIEKRTRHYVDWPPELSIIEKMVLISEDRRFFRHNGIDYRAVLREIFKAITFRRTGGASTIDMQFVRTATGNYERTLRRKSYEMLLAWLIQYRYTKIQILRSYLAIAFFGSRLRGISAASDVVFSIPQDDFTAEQAAFISAMLIYPRPIVPSNEWFCRATRRGRYILSLYPRLKQRFEQLPSWEAL